MLVQQRVHECFGVERCQVVRAFAQADELDGTAKGGIVVAIQEELGVPVKLIGLGEGPDDLAPFDPEAFVDALLD